MKENSHSWDKFIMHASHIKKKKRLQPNFQSLLLNFKIYNCVTKIKSVFNENIDQFWELKKIKSIYNENTNKFLELKKKKSDLYLMKMQISFES